MFKYIAKKEKRQQLALESWFKRVNEVKDPLKLADILLSDWPFANKVKVLVSLPKKKAIQNNIGIQPLESRLENSGCFELAQVVRWLSFQNLPKQSLDEGLKWSECMIKIDIGIRRAVQREIYIKEEAKALVKLLALEGVEDENKRATKKALLQEYETQLEHLNKFYWETIRFLERKESDIPAGILSKAFKSCRTDPDWYLCQWLREGCAKRGGCCGRDCGCCEKARTTERQWNRGHCTMLCGCCIRKQRRSYEDIKSEDFHAEQDFSFCVAAKESWYPSRIHRAYIWRLSFFG